jgi:PAS domain S-box-containing protein
MTDQEMTREELLVALAALRLRVAALEASRAEHEQPRERSQGDDKARSQLARDDLLIARIGQIISSTLEIDEVYARFAQEVRKLVGFDRMSINTIDQKAGIFSIKYLTGQEVKGRHIGAVRDIRGSQTEHLLATGRAVIREDLSQTPRFATDAAFIGGGLRSSIMVPLVSQGRIMGTLSLRSRSVGTYGDREQAVLERLAQRIAPAIENAELYQRTRQAEEALRQSQDVEQRLAAENALLAQTGRIISSTLNIDDVYERFAQETRKLLDFDRMAINVIDQEAGVFTFKYVSGAVQSGRPVPDVVPLPGTQTEYVLQTGQTLVRSDVATDPRFRGDQNLLNSGMRSIMMAPLKSKGGTIGTLSLRSRRVGAYGPGEQSLIERLADQISGAIENAELYAQARQVEQELRESEQRYRALFEQSNEAIFLSSPEGQFLAVNQSAVELFGYARAELIQLDHNDLWANPDEQARFVAELQQHGSVKDLGLKIRKKDGTERDCVITSTLLRDNNGKILASQCVVRDVTERKRWEQALQESEQRFRYLVESAADAFIVFNRAGYLVDVNQRAGDMLGYTRDELLQLTVWDIRADQTEPTWSQLWENLVPEVPITVERLYRHKSGATFPVENRIGLVDLKEERLLFSITRDITERKRTEQMLVGQMRDLAVADERNRLARELHDSVAQSIYSLTLFSETARQLLSTGNEERLEYYLNRLGQTSQQALKEMRLLVHELRPLQLENEGLVGALQHRLNAVEQRAGVDACLLTEGSIELPPNYEFELYRVAQEALNNSLKHAAATAVTVRLVAAGQRVQMEIRDNGKGFDLDTVSTGGGMGLVNMRYRVQELVGELEISSGVDEGTTVKVTVSVGGG